VFFLTGDVAMQGDMEKANGFPVDAFMDRGKVEKNSSQVGFIEFVSLPLFLEVGRVVPMEPMIANLKANLLHYKKKRDELEASATNSNQ
jgi:high affinity cGMP-specific 3',5'-cyclic phosphodiesterase 9